jgi:hypothetical protein
MVVPNDAGVFKGADERDGEGVPGSGPVKTGGTVLGGAKTEGGTVAGLR